MEYIMNNFQTDCVRIIIGLRDEHFCIRIIRLPYKPIVLIKLVLNAFKNFQRSIKKNYDVQTNGYLSITA